MSGPGEDQVAASQLLDVAQSLELQGVNDADAQGMKLHVTMDGIVEHLQIEEGRRETLTRSPRLLNSFEE